MKLNLSKFLETMIQPGLRPQLPSHELRHQYPHHGLYSTTGGGKPKAPNKFPYSDRFADLEMGDEAAEEAAEEDTEKKELPLEGFFKFTKSANDNTSVHRPPTYGRGAPAAYGKSSEEYGAYDPTREEDRDEQRTQTVKGRAHQKVGVFEGDEELEEGVGGGMRDRREPRADTDYSTKHGFASGIPGRDKKDIINGDAKIDELMKDLEKEEGISESLSLKNFFLNEFAPGQHGKRGWADSSFSNLKYPTIARTPVSDLRFWEILDRDNVYMMTGIDEFEDEQKKIKRESERKKSEKADS